MKKHYFGIAILIFSSLPLFINAQNIANTSPDTDSTKENVGVMEKNNIREKLRDNINNRIQNIKNNTDLRNKMLDQGTSSKDMRAPDIDRPPFASSTASTTIRQNIREKVQERKELKLEVFNLTKKIIVKQLEVAINNLKQIRERIQSRITKAEQSGRDMTEAKQLLIVADQKITMADNALNSLKNYQTNTTDQNASSSIPLEKPRNLANTVNKSIKEAKEALNSVVIAIAHSMGLKLGQDKDNANSNASSTTNN